MSYQHFSDPRFHWVMQSALLLNIDGLNICGHAEGAFGRQGQIVAWRKLRLAKDGAASVPIVHKRTADTLR